jgi:hypothetical protein
MGRHRTQGGADLLEAAKHLAELARSSPRPAASFARAVQILVKNAGPTGVSAIHHALAAGTPAPHAAPLSSVGAARESASAYGTLGRKVAAEPGRRRSPSPGAAAIRQASRRRILEEEALSSSEVSELLGSESKNTRQYAMELRKRGELIGVKVRGRHLYPAFQFDVPRRRVYDVVKEVSGILAADRDPWGALSWWLSPNARIPGRRAPKELLADATQHRVLIRLAEAVAEDSG